MNTFWNISDIHHDRPFLSKGLERSDITGNYYSENILQDCISEQACIDVINQIILHLQKRWIYRIVQNLSIWLKVWDSYFSVFRNTQHHPVTLEEIQKTYSDTIHTAFSYMDSLDIEEKEEIKEEILDFIAQS